MIEIITPSRLHITLIDLNADIGRVDGGIGLTLDEPCIHITAEKSKYTIITGNSKLANRMKKSADLVAEALGSGIHIDIKKDYPSHVGLGSGTQSALAAGMAVNKLYDLGLSVNSIAIKVGRGGTSGIGVASFEKGGFILDGGHKFKEKKAFSPSAASKAPPAPVLFQKDFPDWNIVLAIPNLKGAFSAREVDIFQKYCPIPLKEVQTLCHIILMQMLPAIVEEDIVEFGSAINKIQEIGFKRREVELQSPKIKELIKLMQEYCYGAGMSSFGPVVYGIADHPNKVKSTIQKFLDDTLGGEVRVTKARNEGAYIVI